MYALIQQYQLPVTASVNAFGISRASYYRFVDHQPIATEIRRGEIRIQIRSAYQAAYGRYGAPKITAVLNAQRQDHVGQKLVQKLMREGGLVAITRRKYRATRASNPIDERHNILKQDFTTTGPNQKWVGDITYIKTLLDGWTYLCTFMDLYSRRIVGFAYGRDMTDNLVANAFGNAIINRNWHGNLIVHTDLGAQFVSDIFEDQLAKVGGIHSYSRKATPYDNAVIESFHATFKREEHYVNGGHYHSFREARPYVFEYIESWYNRVRIHGALGMVSPVEFEKMNTEISMTHQTP